MSGLERLPPHDVDAEASVIASCLVDDQAITRCMAECSADDFFREKHARIFLVMTELAERSQPTSPIVVANELGKRGQLEAVGGLSFLTQLTTDLPTAVGCEWYAQIVHEAALRRRLISHAGTIANLAYDEHSNPDWQSVRSTAMDLIGSLSQHARAGQRTWQTAAQIEDQAGPARRLWMDDPSVPRGAISGLDAFDASTDGAERGALYYLAGGTGAGKTLFAQALALRWANGQGRQAPMVVSYTSTEMTARKLADRAVFAKGLIDRRKGKQLRHFDPEDFEAEAQASAWFASLPFLVNDSGPFDWPMVKAGIKQAVMQHGAEVAVIDHGDDLTHPSIKEENTYALQGMIAREAKYLAKELDIPILLLSQNSRPPSEMYGDLPTVHSMQNSGKKEQNADWIGQLWRPALYEQTLEPDDPLWNEAYIIVTKNRDGEQGRYPFYVDLPRWQVANWELSRHGEPRGFEEYKARKARKRGAA